ncbi:capping protein-inhibiting regulator of actin dynamics isoform X2 [Triplophysa rosa]|uniref:capping protein-inhibiting regulator of actin dynamics isoform X2 n=1 Tax=Triplophysa rosa TaxID=992332 RepID=UPI002545E6E3|nr:capping protein-inhibiting regulator of actin dynamics isoform X2 [Triplophysa rosa]
MSGGRSLAWMGRVNSVVRLHGNRFVVQLSDCDIMASGSPDATGASDASEAAEECSGKKKSKFQTFKNFFVKKKIKESPPPLGEGMLNDSQSSDDVTKEPPMVQTIKHDELGSKINMGNKAMSHDSVFVSDSPLSENNDALGASQDSIHGKVKSLQLQLKQAIRLGSPPAFIYARKAEDAGAFSDDDGLPCSPSEYFSLHTVLATPPHTVADLTQSSSCLSMEASDSDDDQMSYESSSRPSTPQGPVPADFSLPASSISCLDSTAARHRIAVKAKACARRKPVSMEMLQTKRRDLREKLLLRETEDKLRMVPSIVEEESEDSLMIQDSDKDESKTASIASEHKDEELADSLKSSVSAGDSSEEEERVSDEDHVHKSEILESPWDTSPVTLQLQADDFLLVTGCEVVPEEQGSLLEEVLSSLKSPLVLGLALKHENAVLQSEVANVKTESAEAQLEENTNMDLLSRMITNEQVPQPDSLSDSTVDSVEITEETLEKEESVELPKFASVSKCNVEKELNKTENAKEVQGKTNFKEKLETTDMAEAFPVNVKEKNHIEVLVEDNVELMIETKVEEKEGGLVLVELEKRNDADVEESQDITEPSKTDKDETPEELKVTDIENVAASDPTVGDDAFNTSESSRLALVEVISPTVSHKLDAPILHSPFFNTSACPLEKENEPSSLCVSVRPQEVLVTEQKEVLESPVERQITSAEVQPRFTIAPAWQRSLVSGVAREQLQIISPSTEVTKACDEPPQTTELLTPAKEERSLSKPARTQSSPARIHSSPMRKETLLVEEESTPDNPFGVRLRRTAVIRRYVMDGDSSPTRRSLTGSERLEAVETPEVEQHESKPITPKKPDLHDTVMSVRKVPEPVVRISGGGIEPPSWISVARQKQRNFIENSPEEDFTRPASLPSLSTSITQEQLAQPCSTIKVFCSIEMVEKESKRAAIPSAAPLAQDEPPWMALAKKKAKAWSEMPQIVQ